MRNEPMQPCSCEVRQPQLHVLFAGQAVSNVFDGVRDLDGSQLKGITRRCRLGVLTLFEVNGPASVSQLVSQSIRQAGTMRQPVSGPGLCRLWTFLDAHHRCRPGPGVRGCGHCMCRQCSKFWMCTHAVFLGTHFLIQFER
jgi:hypothetical protein